jgi:hypothetical protein
MTFRRPTSNVLAAAIFVIAVGLLWFAAAPTRFGGSVDYLALDRAGTESTFDRGDLLVLLPQRSYRVGDVIAYRNRGLHRTVVDRLVRREGDLFVFGGANNASRQDLVGRRWFAIPGGARPVRWTTSRLTLVAGLATFVLLLGAGAVSTRKRKSWKQLATRVERAFLRPSLFAGGAFGLLAINAEQASPSRLVDREFALLGFVLSALFAAVALSARRVARKPDELTRIRRRYSHWIRPVVNAPQGTPVDTPTFERLIAIAGTTERMIRQITHSGVTTFYIDDGDVVYRYRVEPQVPGAARAPARRVTAG